MFYLRPTVLGINFLIPIQGRSMLGILAQDYLAHNHKQGENFSNQLRKTRKVLNTLEFE
jgi:hypothetical protein